MIRRATGRVVGVTGLVIEVEGLSLPVGAMARIEPDSAKPVGAEVIGFRAGRTLMMPVAEPQGIATGNAVRSSSMMQCVAVGRQLLGRVVDGMGRCLDAGGPIVPEAQYPILADPPAALTRRPIDAPLPTGVRAMDTMLTVGRGQRVGIFAGTGVGKSVLMGMIARNTQSDVTVAALVGERGREAGDFLRKEIGEDGAKRAVTVVSTSDESPVMRVRACFVATAIAEYFRDLGNDVLLMMDSTTRMAMAQRQIGLAVGEPPATKGYTPSVFALLPRLLERAGRTERGSITGLYTVLVEGDDINEPISDAVRGILDGHVWLGRDLANRGHYPAVSVLESVSRVMPDVVDAAHLAAARGVKRVLASWADVEDLVNIGAYVRGSSADFDVAVMMKPKIDAMLQQAAGERCSFEDARAALIRLHDEIVDTRQRLTSKAGPAKPGRGGQQPARQVQPAVAGGVLR